MRIIYLTKGLNCIVDDDDYEKLSEYKWYAQGRIGAQYAARRKTISRGIHKMVYMHREIIHTISGLQTDHINGNKLDNRKLNLRACNATQNAMAHRFKRKSTSSQFKGVSWNKEKRKWNAYITLNKKRKNLGYFKSEIQAANRWDLEAIKRDTEFFHLNFPNKLEKLELVVPE